MRIKKYVAKSMREALLTIKDELGEDAIILKTRKLPKKVFALGAQDEIEVTAAVDEDKEKKTVLPLEPLKLSATPGVYARPRPAAEMISRGSNFETTSRPWIAPDVLSSPHESVAAPMASVATMPQSRRNDESLHYLEIKEDLKELRQLVKTVLETGGTTAAGGFTGGWAILYKRLIDSEVKTDIAEKIVQSVAGGEALNETGLEKKFISMLADHFPVAGPLRLKKNAPLVIAFVGPTGSGKTTTLAKLAAHCSLNKNKSVSIITADTYRIAAIEQIRMFADIVKIGLQVVFSPDEILAALESCENNDIVFVDTAGRSQRNHEHMGELKKLLAVLRPDETHLVMSATTKDSDLLDTIERYQSFGINRLLFTKLDETVRLGNILNIVSTSAVPVSYFTFGQSVPDDIELAQAGAFVQRLWEGRTL